MTIKYYRKNVYGNEMMYAKSEEGAEAIRLISNGYETITPSMREGLEKLGFTFQEALAPNLNK